MKQKGTVLFINPSVDDKSQNKKVKAIIYKTFPTSLAVLAGCLISAGFDDVRILDEQVNSINLKDLENVINSMNSPKLVGLSVLTLNSGRAFEIAKQIKQIDPEVITVFGGIHPTVAGREVLKSGEVDIVVRGEAEITIVELVERISQKEDYSDLLGISFLDKKTGELVLLWEAEKVEHYS